MGRQDKARRQTRYNKHFLKTNIIENIRIDGNYGS